MFSRRFDSRSVTAVTALIAVLVVLMGCGPAELPTTVSPTQITSPSETISAPARIEGPDWSYVIQDQETYTPGGATSSVGHNLEYRIDWGDEKLSGWTDHGAGHTWEESGEYPIKAQARCKDHPVNVSSWSDVLITVEVTWE